MPGSVFSSVPFQIVAILMLLMLNGLFALSEIAVVSARKSRLQEMAEEDPRAQTALDLAEDSNEFLATVQIGITLVGILAGAVGEATLSDDFARLLADVPILARYADPISFVVIVSTVTFLSLMIGELIPKAVALQSPEKFAMRVAAPMAVLARLMTPLVTFLSRTTELMLNLLRLTAEKEPPVTEEEVKALLQEGAEAGVFERFEQHIVTQALEFDDISLRPLITHRTRVVWLDVADSVAQIRAKIDRHPVTSYPVCDGNMDSVLGTATARDVLLALLDRPDATGNGDDSPGLDLQALMQLPVFVPLVATPVQVLQEMREKHVHIVYAIDEYGGVEGIITPTDVLDAIVGPRWEQPDDT